MPSWRNLKTFCERDGWELYKETDHWFYRKRMPDGTLKRTKVSMGTGQIQGHLWKQILKKQLQVSEEYFNKFSQISGQQEMENEKCGFYYCLF